MKGDTIIADGRPARACDLIADPEELLSGSYAYRRIHAFEHRPLHADAVISLAADAMQALYATTAPLSAARLAEDVRTLLRDNRYPAAGSNLVTLYLFPPAGTASYILSCSAQMLYKGYTLWHAPQAAISVRYEYAFPLHRTSMSLHAHNHALAYARRLGADVALCENHDDILVGAGEYPLFAVRGNRISTTPLCAGAAASVERLIAISAILDSGYALAEEPLTPGAMGDMDELFYCAPQGIYPIRSFDGKLFPDIVARTVASRLAAATR